MIYGTWVKLKHSHGAKDRWIRSLILTFSVVLVRWGWFCHSVVVGGKDGSLTLFPDPVGCAIAVWFTSVVAGERWRLVCLLILQAWRGRYPMREVVAVFGVTCTVFQAVCTHIIAWSERSLLTYDDMRRSFKRTHSKLAWHENSHLFIHFVLLWTITVINAYVFVLFSYLVRFNQNFITGTPL